MPVNKQSIAGSLFQTLTRLCTAVSFGIATAIFNNVQKNPSQSGYYAGNPVEPFAAVFWFSAACSFIGVILVPFLRITTQGHKGDTGRVKSNGPGHLALADEHAVVTGAKEATEANRKEADG